MSANCPPRVSAAVWVLLGPSLACDPAAGGQLQGALEPDLGVRLDLGRPGDAGSRDAATPDVDLDAGDGDTGPRPDRMDAGIRDRGEQPGRACRLAFEPREVAVPQVRPLARRRFAVLLRNTGEGPCTSLGVSSSRAFVTATLPPVSPDQPGRLEVGELAVVELRSTVPREGSFEAVVTATAADARAELPVRAVGHLGLTHPAPDYVDVAPLASGCRARERTVRIYNWSDTPRRVVRAETLYSTAGLRAEISTTSSFKTPARDAGLEAAKVTLTVTDDAPALFSDLLRVELDDGSEHVVPVFRVGGATPVEARVSTPRDPARVLLVIDSTGSMANEQAALQRAFGRWLTYRDTTSPPSRDLWLTSFGGSCCPGFDPGPQIVGACGRAREPETPSADRACGLREQGRTSALVELASVFSAAVVLDQAALLSGRLGIVVWTDENEFDLSPAAASAAVLGAFGWSRRHDVWMTKPRLDGARLPTELGPVHALAEELGVVGELGAASQDDFARGRRRTFLLEHPAAETSIDVSVDGESVPSSDWTYLESARAIVFPENEAPPLGATVAMTYDSTCSNGGP